VRELRAVLVDGFGTAFLTGAAPAALRPAPGLSGAVVWVVDSAASQELVAAFAAAVRAWDERVDARLLIGGEPPEGPLPAGVTVARDPSAFQSLRLPWYPALVHVGADGALKDAAPVGSLDALTQVLGRFERSDAVTSRRSG
jgi:hypothetical protein